MFNWNKKEKPFVSYSGMGGGGTGLVFGGGSVEASGGVIETNGSYTTHTFVSPGPNGFEDDTTQTFVTGTDITGVLFFVIGGGGGGGYAGGGGSVCAPPSIVICAEYAEAFAVVIKVTTTDCPMLILALSAVEPLYLMFGTAVVDSAVVNR